MIGGYIDQLHELGEFLDAPIVQGATTNKERERLFDAFRAGEISTLVISKVGNFSIDLPEAAVAIQVSGTFGSRQEEAQRLGRVLRPKARRPAGALLHGGRRGTRSTPSTPPTGSGSSPSRGTRTRSSTPTTCSVRPCPCPTDARAKGARPVGRAPHPPPHHVAQMTYAEAVQVRAYPVASSRALT